MNDDHDINQKTKMPHIAMLMQFQKNWPETSQAVLSNAINTQPATKITESDLKAEITRRLKRKGAVPALSL
jgi:hypothetical protein